MFPQDFIEKLSFREFKKLGWAAAAGAAIVLIVVFSTGWMVTSATAHKQARQFATEKVDQCLADICVYQFRQSEQTGEKLQKLRQMKYSWDRADYIKKHGWSTMPGQDSPSPGVADNCAKMLLQMSEKND